MNFRFGNTNNILIRYPESEKRSIVIRAANGNCICIEKEEASGLFKAVEDVKKEWEMLEKEEIKNNSMEEQQNENCKNDRP